MALSGDQHPTNISLIVTADAADHRSLSPKMSPFPTPIVNP